MRGEAAMGWFDKVKGVFAGTSSNSQESQGTTKKPGAFSDWKNLFFIVAVFVIGFFGFTARSGATVSLALDEQGLTAVGPKNSGYSIRADYADIENVYFVEELDLGTMQEGTQTKRAWYGTWESGELGSCEICLNPQIKGYCVIQTQQKTIVLNYENANTTKQLVEGILRVLEEK